MMNVLQKHRVNIHKPIFNHIDFRFHIKFKEGSIALLLTYILPPPWFPSIAMFVRSVLLGEISDLLSAGSGVGDASSCVARAVIGGWLIVSLLIWQQYHIVCHSVFL
jgi:hypothetical protein